MNALLVIDIQNDFCPGGALPARDGDKIIPVVNTLMDIFDHVIASKDEHPADSRHFESWPKHCVKGTWGADFHPDLNTNKINQILVKGTGVEDDGYSAFDATNTDLKKYLNDKHIDTVYLAGLTTDYCVKNSAIDAVNEGFKTIVIEDAVKGVEVEKGDVHKAILAMSEKGITFTYADQIVK
jgi:nicotinamidase/pyrazinamidase